MQITAQPLWFGSPHIPNLEKGFFYTKRISSIKRVGSHDHGTRDFSVGDHVYLRVRPRKSSLKLGSCAKLSPRYCGSFEVLERIGPDAYILALPASTRAHNVFHVSWLKKYVHDCNHVINWDVIQVEPEGGFQAEPLCILDKKVTMLQNQVVG